MSASLAERSRAAAARRSAAERRAERKANPPLIMITLTVMLGLIMAIIDTSIVNVALNDMAGNARARRSTRSAGSRPATSWPT